MDLARYCNLRFEPLTEAHLSILHSWLHQPHIREFYHKRSVPKWEEFRAEYLQRINPDWPTRCFLSRAADIPMGYIQTYRLADYPEYAAMIGENNGISLDLFIGDTTLLGVGWGRLMLLKFLSEVAFPLFHAEQVCWLYHDKLNRRALTASRAAGFTHIRDFAEEGDRKELLVVRKDEALVLTRQIVCG